MNERIKELAEQAGMDITNLGRVIGATDDRLERFTELIRADEREACAKLCEDEAKKHEQAAQDCIDNNELDEVSAIRSTCWKLAVCAEAIRARSNHE